MSSLTDHASYLSNKITFVLDAMLGVVNLEQNNIIKLFSVMAVVLMPPTLIASIYGMNFKMMPELEWVHGYPMALVMMLVAAVLPYFLFSSGSGGCSRRNIFVRVSAVVIKMTVVTEILRRWALCCGIRKRVKNQRNVPHLYD